MLLTIFTPSYNRAACLHTLYESLCRQTDSNFEWIVIDDGSSDNTEDVLQGFIDAKPPFNIRAFSQENGGKHRAINRAVQIAQGEFFFIVDSDDYLTDDAVEKIKKWCDEIETLPNKSSYAGVSGLKMLFDGTVVGGHGHNEQYIDATNLQRKKFGLMGDKAEVYKTNILRQFPFKEFQGENFLTEGTVWNKIAEKNYKLRWYMEPIYLCEYRADGLTMNIKQKNLENFEGYTYSVKEQIRLYPFLDRMRSIAGYAVLAEEKGLSEREVANRLEIPYILLLITKRLRQIYHCLLK